MGDLGPAPRLAVDLAIGDEPMEDRARNPDPIDEATARFWSPRTLDEVLADVRPITSWDDLAIPDLSDEEWEAFAAALRDD